MTSILKEDNLHISSMEKVLRKRDDGKIMAGWYRELCSVYRRNETSSRQEGGGETMRLRMR